MSLGSKRASFDIKQWQAHVFLQCDDDADHHWSREWNGLSELPEVVGFQIHMARQCLRLLRRLWTNPGDRVEGFLPEQELWQWLRRQVLGQTCAWQLWVIETSHPFPDLHYRWNAARRLDGLVPLVAQARRDPGRRESEEQELDRAADVLSGLVVDTRSFHTPDLPWPRLTMLSNLIDDLVRSRLGPVPFINNPRRLSPGAPRKGPELNALYRRLIEIFEEYDEENLRPPTKKDMADAFGFSVTTLDERIKELKLSGYTWPIDIRNSA